MRSLQPAEREGRQHADSEREPRRDERQACAFEHMPAARPVRECRRSRSQRQQHHQYGEPEERHEQRAHRTALLRDHDCTGSRHGEGRARRGGLVGALGCSLEPLGLAGTGRGQRGRPLPGFSARRGGCTRLGCAQLRGRTRLRRSLRLGGCLCSGRRLCLRGCLRLCRRGTGVGRGLRLRGSLRLRGARRARRRRAVRRGRVRCSTATSTATSRSRRVRRGRRRRSASAWPWAWASPWASSPWAWASASASSSPAVPDQEPDPARARPRREHAGARARAPRSTTATRRQRLIVRPGKVPRPNPMIPSRSPNVLSVLQPSVYPALGFVTVLV